MIQSAIVKPPSGECRNGQTEWRVGDGGADLGQRPYTRSSNGSRILIEGPFVSGEWDCLFRRL
jgi:hypothetical protein